MKFLLVIASALVLLASGAARADANPASAYSVVAQYPDFELREYAPYIVAEVRVSGPFSEAGNQGFRILAGYIFGKNKGERQLAMSTPVTQEAEPKKIAMTTPVTQEPAGAEQLLQFRMPEGLTLATLPEALDPRVTFREIAGGRFAAIRYSGRWTDANYGEHLAILQNAVAAAGLRTSGEPVFARYNPPLTPWFLRRNEIWLKVD